MHYAEQSAVFTERENSRTYSSVTVVILHHYDESGRKIPTHDPDQYLENERVTDLVIAHHDYPDADLFDQIDERGGA